MRVWNDKKMHLNPYRLDLLCAIAGRVTTGASPAPFQSITRVNNRVNSRWAGEPGYFVVDIIKFEKAKKMEFLT